MVKNRFHSRFMYAESIMHVLSAYTAKKGNPSPWRYAEISYACGSEIFALLLPPITASMVDMLDEHLRHREAVNIASVRTRSSNTSTSSL